MSRRWKLAVLGILTLGATTLASTLTTAYLMRPPAPTPALDPAAALDVPPAAEHESRAPIVRITPPRRNQRPPHTALPSSSPADEVVTAP